MSAQQKNTTTDSVSPQCSLQLACDMHVACYVERYDDEEPQIGRIVTLHDRSVEVEWMIAAYDDRWSVCKQTHTFYKRLKKRLYHQIEGDL